MYSQFFHVYNFLVVPKLKFCLSVSEIYQVMTNMNLAYIVPIFTIMRRANIYYVTTWQILD